MRVVTTLFKRVGRLLTVFVVVLISLVAGLFLTACRKAQPEKNTPQPAGKPAASTDKSAGGTGGSSEREKADTGKEKPAGKQKVKEQGEEEAKVKETAKEKRPDVKKPTIDDEETEKGQPIPRNLLE